MVDLDELERLHKKAQSSTSMMDTAAFIFSISHACDDGLLERLRTAERERDRLTDRVTELENAPWPEWAEKIRNAVREVSGYDGYDDAVDGVDLHAEVDDLIREFGNVTGKLGAALASITALKAENERLRAALGEIDRRHIPDQPAGYSGDELAWAQRHVGTLRGIARTALETANG